VSGASSWSSRQERPIGSLLVANRGEIARRVFDSARAMGIRCVAVFADADAEAPFVAEADSAVRLEGGYLDAAGILAAARRVGADAVHPGYGFLSENAEFARSVTAAGLIWVGPPADAIAAMGDKIEAKRRAAAAGVPVLGSWPGPEDLPADVGYPLLVKAAAGGGGKGMRVVREPGGLDEAVAAARREALSGFGDDRVFIERFLERSRHIEIQILGDSHGSLVHLGERECSIQRRHQKIIEEAPSPVVGEQLRSAMGDSAVALASSLGYQSAGTVEFLLDEDSGEFWFLEVNTRLQVEHPVTEMVTGIDLVREQLRVAAGERLGYDQSAITRNGHAIEARLYAEDPANGFLPATGTLDAYRPAAEPQVRWDSGVRQGSSIGVDYDPMIAKVTAHGATRRDAAMRLAAALERLHIGGVVTNRGFLAATLRHPAFLAGDTTTDFIERHWPKSIPACGPDDAELNAAAITAAMALQLRNRARDDSWGFAPSNWRNAPLPPERVTLLPSGASEPVTVAYLAQRDGSFACETRFGDGPETASCDASDDRQADRQTVRIHSSGPSPIGGSDGTCGSGTSSAAARPEAPELTSDPGWIDIEIDGLRRCTQVTLAADRVHVQTAAGTVSFAVQPRFSPHESPPAAGGLAAPMPGVVMEIRCSPGDAVAAGTVVAVIEAMKMEHHIRAPFAGTVSAVPVSAGAQVDNGALLVVIEQTPTEDAGEARPEPSKSSGDETQG